MKFNVYLLTITANDGTCINPAAFTQGEYGTLHRFLSADTLTKAVNEAQNYEKLFNGPICASISEYVASGIAPITVREGMTVYMDIMRKSICTDNEWMTTLQAYMTNDYVITVHDSKKKTFSIV